jgi:hypothetical protein
MTHSVRTLVLMGIVLCVIETQFVVLLFLTGWWINARLTGWKALWECYHADRAFEGRFWRGQRVWMQKRKVYRDLITVNLGAGGGGLFLQICWPFTGRPLPLPWDLTLRVPWREVTAEWLRLRRRTCVQFRFEQRPEVKVRMSVEMAREIAGEAREAWSGGKFLCSEGPQGEAAVAGGG